MTTASAGSARKVLLAFLIALIPYAWLTWRFNWLVDDAFISFRYAKHLAQGFGLCFNVGESPPVEGYSNFLWVLMLAPFEAIGWSAPDVSRVLSVAFGVALLWRVTRFIGMSLRPFLPTLILSAVFFATLPPLAAWSTSGLGTMPYALLVFLTFEFVLGGREEPRGLAGGVACALLILIRADGMIWVGAMIALACLSAWQDKRRSAIKPLAICVAIALGTLVGLTIFRLLYFGWPLPNTVYAKIGFGALSLERGMKYVFKALLTFPNFLAIMIAGVLFAYRRHRGSALERQAVLMALFAFAYCVAVGGDWMAMGRMLVPGLGFLTLVLAFQLDRIGPRWVPVAACGSVAILLSLLPAFNVHVAPDAAFRATRLRDLFAYRTEYERWSDERRRVGERTEFALALGRHTRPGESLIAMSIGAFGYYTELFLYDLNGLVNVEVAHRDAPRRRLPAGHDKFVPREFFLDRRPTYYEAVVINVSLNVDLPREGRIRLGWTRPLPFKRPPEVVAQYQPIGYSLPDDPETGKRRLLVLFIRRDVLHANPTS